MEYSSFASTIEQFEIFDAFTKLEGEFNFLKPQFSFQPYADLQTQKPATAEIGLRLITNFYDREDVCLEFISESRCFLNYSDPSNEDDLFLEISEKAINAHSKLFSKEMEEIGFLHSTFAAVNEVQKKKIFQTLIEHFREQF